QAYSNTYVYGTIICLSAGLYDFPATIDRFLTIDCPGGVVTGRGTTITDGGAKLRNLKFDGFFSFGFGIKALDDLFVENCQISGFGASGMPGFGIQFAPGRNRAAKLYVIDSVIYANFGAGIAIAPTENGSAFAVIDRTRVEAGGAHGIVADGTGTFGSAVVQI